MVSQDLLTLIKAEYREMPGLSLSLAQACRLWQLDPEAASNVLTELVADGILHRTPRGHFAALPTPAGIAAKARLRRSAAAAS